MSHFVKLLFLIFLLTVSSVCTAQDLELRVSISSIDCSQNVDLANRFDRLFGKQSDTSSRMEALFKDIESDSKAEYRFSTTLDFNPKHQVTQKGAQNGVSYSLRLKPSEALNDDTYKCILDLKHSVSIDGVVVRQHSAYSANTTVKKNTPQIVGLSIGVHKNGDGEITERLLTAYVVELAEKE